MEFSSDRQCSSPKLVTLNTMTLVGEHGMRFAADVHFSEAEAADVILVPGGSGSKIAMEDPKVIAYLQEQSNCGKTILSVCTGSFLMQKAGLFNGRRATTIYGRPFEKSDVSEYIRELSPNV